MNFSLPIGETQLDPAATMDIYNLYNMNLPLLRTSRNVFTSMIFCKPFTVKMKKLGIMANKEVEKLIELYHMPFNKDVYDWEKMYGIIPVYFKRLRDTTTGSKVGIHRIPCVPKFGSGIITTFVNKKHDQEFKWYWTHDIQGGYKEEKSMHWIIGENPPNIYGKYTSNISTLLDDYKTLKIIRQATEITAFQSSRPPLLLEYHPPKNQTAEESLTTLQAFGPKIAGDVVEQEENLKSKRFTVRTNELVTQMYSAHLHNRGMQLKNDYNPFLYTDNASEQANRSDYGLSDRVIPLRPDFKYVKVATPTVAQNLEIYIKNLDVKAAALMDFPVEMIQGTNTTRATNIQGNLRFINERIKYMQRFFEQVNKYNILKIYGNDIQSKLDHITGHFRKYSDEPHKILKMYVSAEVEVELACNPIISEQQIEALWQNGMVSKKYAAEKIFDLYGLPENEIKLFQTPDGMPVENKESAKKPQPKKKNQLGTLN